MKTLIGEQQKRGSVIRNPTLKQRQEWHREGTKLLPKDLHPHERWREEHRRWPERTRRPG